MLRKKIYLALLLTGVSIFSINNNAWAQLVIDNAVFTIQSGATVTVQGNITSNVDIQGTGKVLLKGLSGAQSVSMNGKAIPNLEIENTSNATLASNLKISNSIVFTSGKIQLGDFTTTLSSGTTVTGAGAGKFFETTGTGFVRKEITSAGTYTLPVGTGTDYTPLAYTNTGGTYGSGAYVATQAKGVASPNKHPRTESYLTVYWPLEQSGITGATTSVLGTYQVDSRVTGPESDIKGLLWNGTNWSATGGTQNTTTNIVGASLAGNTAQLYGMNTFVLMNAKVFLQGTYNSGTGKMNDKLRTSAAYSAGNLPATNLLPNTDPYRLAPYNFPQTTNLVAENVISTSFANPFIDQVNADNNIVDWVYLELRTNTTPGNTVVQTRSALLQRDGDVVDIDGVSPVYFKNLPAATYTITVKHRNHLAISTNPAVFNKALDLTSGTALDFTTTAAANLMGTAGSSYFNNGSINMMYSGNANSNANVRWGAPSGDKDYILGTATILNNNPTTVLSNVYSQGDIDMNRNVRWGAPSSDKDLILSVPLLNVPSNVRTQTLPN